MKNYLKILIVVAVIISTAIIGVIVYLCVSKEQEVIINEGEIILNEKDFFYKNKDSGGNIYTIWLGMSKEDCQAVLSREKYEIEYEDMDENDEPVSGDGDAYLYPSLELYFHNEKLDYIYPTTYPKWESYKGINYKTTDNNLLEIFGLPTIQYPESSFAKMDYVFVKIDDENYKKIASKQELIGLIKNGAKTSEMMMFSIFKEYRNPKRNSFSMSYFSEGENGFQWLLEND